MAAEFPDLEQGPRWANATISTAGEQVLFINHGTVFTLSGPAPGPDLAGLDDRGRIVLRALLTLCLARLDAASERAVS